MALISFFTVYLQSVPDVSVREQLEVVVSDLHRC